MIANLIIGILSVLLCILIPNKKKGLVAALFVTTFFLAIRFEWGNDYNNYLEWFQNISKYSFLTVFGNESLSHHGEWLWSILYLLFQPVGFFGFVIAISVFENWVVYRVIRNHVDENFYWLSILIYVFTAKTFAMGASMMRQFFCICCFMLVVELMLKRKLLWSIIIIVLCSFIHRSNIVTLAFLPIFYIKIKEKKIAPFFYIIILGFYFIWSTLPTTFFANNIGAVLSDDLSDLYLHYSERELANANTGLGQIFSLITLAAIIYIIPKATKDHQAILLFFIASYFLNPLILVVPMISRFTLYCEMFSCIVWPMFFHYIKTKPIVIILTTANIVLLLKMFYDFYFSPVWIDSYMVYKTIFEAPAWL